MLINSSQLMFFFLHEGILICLISFTKSHRFTIYDLFSDMNENTQTQIKGTFYCWFGILKN